jgi:site-specific DNA-methyltransferase (adenine-specific)
MFNKIWNTDCVQGLAKLEANSIPLTVTSPPWDDLFDYGGHQWDWLTFQCAADHLWRVTAQGGVVCWDIGDTIKEGSLTGTVARQTVYFMERGFRFWEKLVIHKNGLMNPNPNRHGLPPEEVLVFSKGKPRVFHQRRKPNNPQWIGKPGHCFNRNPDGSTVGRQRYPIQPESARQSQWNYTTDFEEGEDSVVHARLDHNFKPDHFTNRHPTRMSSSLVRDLIQSYSDAGDLVLDPFIGSGTTAVQALLAGRSYLGMEVYDEYVAIAERAVREAVREMREEM